MKDIKIVRKSEFETNEKKAAKDYWSNINFKSYTVEQPWSKFIAKNVMNYKPNRVFEFGCNAGKNLIEIKNIDSSIDLYGIDINCKAIEFGQDKHNLNVFCSDENVLNIIPDNTYDVVYTVSVLDHVPEPEKILLQLLRIASKGVLLLEPWIGEEGKVVKNLNLHTDTVIDTTPYSYSWDYENLIKPYLDDWNLSVQEYKLESNLGRFYYLYKITAKNK